MPSKEKRDRSLPEMEELSDWTRLFLEGGEFSVLPPLPTRPRTRLRKMPTRAPQTHAKLEEDAA